MSSRKKLSPCRQAAQDYGIDVGLLDAILTRTPSERIVAHQNALELAELLRQAGQNARSKKTSRTPTQK